MIRRFIYFALLVMAAILLMHVNYVVGYREGARDCPEFTNHSESIWIQDMDLNPLGKWTWYYESFPYADSGWIRVNYWILDQDIYEINIKVSNTP